MPVYIISYNPIILIYSLKNVYESRVCAGQSRDCPDLRFAHEQSQDCAANPWFVPQTMDPGFAQDNPGFAQIHALRVTYSYKMWMHNICIFVTLDIKLR